MHDRKTLSLSVAALGVVYGDIGTSPIYALRECFYGEHGIAPTPANVLGVLSLITWALMLVVTLKYLTIVLRADNRGEGGHHRAGRAAQSLACAARFAALPADAARPVRRGAAVWRWRDHPGDLGAVGHRGPERGSPGAARAGGAADPADHRRHLPDAAARHRRHRRAVRSRHDPLVPDPGGARRARRDRQSGGAGGAVADPCGRFLPPQRQHRLPGAQFGVLGRHRCRGAVRRHGPTSGVRRSAARGCCWCCRRCC